MIAGPTIGFTNTEALKTQENHGTVGVELIRSGPDTSQMSTVLVTANPYVSGRGKQSYKSANRKLNPHSIKSNLRSILVIYQNPRCGSRIVIPIHICQ